MKRAAFQRGVTLIELMVGVFIGLLATIVISQSALWFEGRKRNTTSGSDAQLNGALALHTIQRDIKMAGYGLLSGGTAACIQIQGKYASNATQTWTMAPVLITQGSGGTSTVSGNPDTIQVLMSSNSQFAVPMRIGANHRRDDTVFVLDDRTNLGNSVGDLILAVPNTGGTASLTPSPTNQVMPNWCSLFTVTASAGNNLTHATGSGAPWNHDSTSTIFPGAAVSDVSYAAGGYLVNLGTLTDRTYALVNNTLRMTTFNSTNAGTTTEDLFPQIVNLQAVYGHDQTVPKDNTVDVWNATAPTTTDGWARVIAIRVAVVARSTQYEPDVVTSTQPTWRPDGTNVQTLSIDGLSDWQHYRYRVFEAVIPLRNMLWQS